MTVYAVIEISNEGGYLVGVYSTRAQAEAVAVKHGLAGMLPQSIREIVVDYDPPLSA